MRDVLILVIDDDADLGAVLLEVIQSSGYRGRATTSMTEARAVLADEQPDLVLLDWHLPNGDAAELAELCHARGIPVVVSSASAKANDYARSIGAAGVLKKPFDIKSLYSLIDGILHARPSEHPQR